MITNYGKLRELFGDYNCEDLIDTPLFREILALIAEAERRAGERVFREVVEVYRRPETNRNVNRD